MSETSDENIRILESRHCIFSRAFKWRINISLKLEELAALVLLVIWQAKFGLFVVEGAR